MNRGGGGEERKGVGEEGRKEGGRGERGRKGVEGGACGG